MCLFKKTCLFGVIVESLKIMYVLITKPVSSNHILTHAAAKETSLKMFFVIVTEIENLYIVCVINIAYDLFSITILFQGALQILCV